MINFVIQTSALLIVLVSHELSHALVAYWNGDDTAKKEGRLTINPLKHLDLTGTLMMLIFKFGWAKPVPINQYKFKHRKLGLFLVSLAGIFINLLTSFILIGILINFNVRNKIVYEFLRYLIAYGLVFGVFNLIPIPPLDGSKILASFLPDKFQYYIYKYENIFFILLMFLLYTKAIHNIMDPVISFLYKIFIEFYLNISSIL